MSLKLPDSTLRKLTFAAGFVAALLAYGLPAQAQGISLLRDTETEEMLRSYETPLARAAGLDPVPKVWLVGMTRSTPSPPMAMAARTSSSSPASCSGCRSPMS